MFVVSSTLPALNEYINKERGSKMGAAQIKKKVTTNIRWEILSQKVKRVDDLIDLKLFWIQPNNKKDPDNVFFGIKFILDAMVAAGVIEQDGRKNIRNIFNHIETQKGKTQVIVEIHKAI